MWLNSLEYQIPVVASDKFYLVSFIDSGTVERKVEIKDYRVTAGVGMRIVVPMLGPVPIALDFGFRSSGTGRPAARSSASGWVLQLTAAHSPSGAGHQSMMWRECSRALDRQQAVGRSVVQVLWLRGEDDSRPPVTGAVHAVILPHVHRFGR